MYFGVVLGNYGLQFWLPQILKDTSDERSVQNWLVHDDPLGRNGSSYGVGRLPFR